MAKLGFYYALASSAALLAPWAANAADGHSGTIHFQGKIVAPADCSVCLAGAANDPRGQVQCPPRASAAPGMAPKAASHVRMTPVMLLPDARGVRQRGYVATIEYF